MKQKKSSRLLSLLLVMATLLGVVSLPANAATLADSGTVTIQINSYQKYLNKSTGGTLGGSSWTYTSNDGLTGTAYCVNWGLKAVSPSKALTIQEFNRNPQTMGVYANGYPSRTLEQFKELHQGDVRGINDLTEVEYQYATQVAIWSSCGQLSVPGTSFTAGRASVVEPTSDAQQIRIYDSIVAMLKLAAGWTKHLYTGMYVRAEENRDIRGVEVVNELGLEGAAAEGTDGIKKETINGREYYTRVMYVASATSTWIDDYTTKVYSTDAPSGTIFVAQNNSPLETVTEGSTTYYKVDTHQNRSTNLNANGTEYYGAFKVCIPVDTAAPEGNFNIKAIGGVAQFNLYLAYNPTSSEQSYIISDPGYTTCDAIATFKWSSMDDTDETASLQIVKAGDGGAPLEGAQFTLTGSGGTVKTGTSDRNGRVEWTDLPADETYTLVETAAPEGYTIADPVNITLTPGRTAFMTISDSTEKVFKVKKIDAQNKGVLQGAVFRFEQIDGSYMTTGTTGFDGVIQFVGDDLPYGSYRVTEQSAPEGYQKDTRVETVKWDGIKDVTLTFEDVRDITLILVKVDANTGVSLSNATFDVYADGQLITSVTTNDAGEARITGIKKEAYIEVVETAAPAGYVLDPTPHGIHIDPYDPATQGDPVLTVTNENKPALRILKYDQQTNRPMPDVTFEVYHDATLLGRYTTDGEGEIFLYDLTPGTYLVQEVSTDADHVVNSSPQQIELKEGQTGTQTLVFFNQLKPGIHLVKVDSITMKSLPNVRFEFKLVGGTYKQEFTTDANGEIDLSRLTPGSYEVTELEAPDGYLIDDAVRVVKIDPDENANFIFTNTPKPTLKLVKNSSDGTRLAGVTFRIAKIEDGTHYLDRTTDEKGEIIITGLEPGVYSVVETDTPYDHIPSLREHHVELFPGKTSTIVLENDKKPSLTVVKRDADTGEVIPDTVFLVRAADGHSVDEIKTGADGKATLEHLLPGVYEVTEKSVPSAYLLDAPGQLVTLYPNRNHTVYFENHKKPSLTIVKVDSVTGEVIKGAEFSVWYGSNSTVTGELNDLGVHHTDENGLVELTGLRDGWYKVTEVEAAAGYQIKEPGEQSTYIQGGENKVLTFENIPLSAIVIWKFDSVTGQAISGAEFVLKFLGGTSGTGGTVIGNYRTGANGAVTITGLAMGTYIVEEVSSDPDHVIDTAPQTVVFNGRDQDVVSVYFGNTPKGAAMIRKIDAINHQPLAGVEFLVTDSKGTVIGENNGKYVTDASGSFTISDLEPGITLVVKETKAKNGYILDDAPQTVSVKPGKTVVLEFSNQPNGSLLIRKVCSVNPSVTLANAEFEVKYADGTVIGNSNGIYRTNVNGEILITGLVPGRSVVVTETRAPDGFIKDSQSQTIEIKEGAAAVLTFHNQPKGAIVVQKRDSQTNAPLAGAEFRITTAAGCEVGLDGVIGTSTLTQNGVFVTDAEGEIRISNLAPGAYILNEIKAPKGYVIDNPIIPVVVGMNGDTQTVLVKNSKAGSLLIEKKDSVTGEPLQGVQFKITNANGEFVPDESGAISSNGLYYTDANGQILLKGVVGTLVVTEEKTLDGYVIDETTRSQTVVVNPGDTQTLTYYNVPKNTLTIQKYAIDKQSPLPGVKFKVTDSSGGVIGNTNGIFITNEDGQAIVQNLTPGTTVIAREIETVAGYTLETVPQAILVKEGEPLMLIFGNKPLANLTLIKRDSKGQPLAGAQFLVTDQQGLPIGPYDGHYTTGSNGQVTVTGIRPDVAVTVREEKAPAGYVLNTEPQTITVRSDQDNTLTFVNDKKGTLIVVKVDGETNKPLSGAEFKVTTADGRLVANLEGAVSSNGMYVSGTDGKFTITGLEPGSYIITETKAPSGYDLDPTPVTVQVDPNDTQTITIKNTALASLIIQKYEGTGTTPIAGAVFLVTDDNGAPVGLTEGEFTTDNSGRIVISGLTPGMSVTVREIRVPDPYILDGTPKTTKITAGASKTLTFRNEKKVSLSVYKYKEGTTEPLAGVKFKVTVSDGSALPNNGIFVTNAQGQFVVPNLTPGVVVTAQEVETVNGYDLDPYPQSITIQSDGSGQSATGNGQSLSFGNKPLANLTLVKVDSITKKPLAGAKFLATDESGAAVGATGGHFITGENGQVTITGIKPGITVTVKEEEAPSGYALNVHPQTITVQSGKDNRLVFDNDPLCNLTVRKVDSRSGDPLSGAQFLVTNQDGSPVGASDGHFTTGANGTFTVSGLTPGAAITVREEKAPAGYTLNQEPQTIVVKSGEDNTLTFANEAKGTLIILKLDKTNSKPIQGAEFKITTASGELVANLEGATSTNGMYISDENGEIRITGLAPGSYVITETKAPSGYLLNTQPTTVEVKTHDTQTIRIYNTPVQGLTIQKFIDGTNTPIQGVTFLITDSNGTLLGPSNGEFTTDRNGRIMLDNLTPGTTIIAKEVRAASGYVLDATPQSITIREGEQQILTFFNKAEGGLELIKVNEADKSQRIPGVTFEIRRMDGALVDTVTTDKTGRAHINLDAGDYYAVEIETAQGFKLDSTPNYFTVKDGAATTLTVTNKPFSGILIHKVDAVTGKGISGVTFLLYNSGMTPIGQYTSDNTGHVYIEGLTTSGRYYLRELSNEGYIVDTEMKTVYVTAGETTLVEWKNTPITAQIQIIKKSADYNSTNGLPAGTPLSGAVFEIYDKANNVVDTIKSDSRGLAVSRQLPLGRYTVKEVKAPANYGVSDTVLNAYLEHSGQIVTFEVTNKSLSTGVSITKTGPKEIMAGQPVRYQFSGIANTSNVRLGNFYWRDTLPAEVRLDKVVTGTYNFPGVYKIVYRVNGGDYRTLADNLSTSKNYTLAASATALGLASNERVTEIMFVFGQAPAAFAQVEAPNLYCTAISNITSTSFVNVADVGGTYNDVWIQAVSRWVTNVYGKPVTLPRTGY